jgi:aarF domain-containing kinase
MRGSNINDDDAAASDTVLQVVEMRGGSDSLPTVYDPEALQAYFNQRPGAVLTRVAQIVAVGGAWAAKTAFKALKGELTAGSEGEVSAVAGPRNVLVALGPFYIKLGQALSIRPDILSPQAMVQLQQLCDKVPPFDSAIAMDTIKAELGREVSEIFSEITPEPVAAASLGQVYRATLRASGDEVAVKVQRPFVLETVSLDLHLARQAGLALRKFGPEKAKQTLDLVSLLDGAPVWGFEPRTNPGLAEERRTRCRCFCSCSRVPRGAISGQNSQQTSTASSTTNSSVPMASASPRRPPPPDLASTSPAASTTPTPTISS